TAVSSGPSGPSTVHPHVRGAHSGGRETCYPTNGPSPRAWGSQGPKVPQCGLDRSIPTCVGLTRRNFPRRFLRPVHPHVRGAHRPAEVRAAVFVRSIPTCVGLTPGTAGRTPAPTVHP